VFLPFHNRTQRFAIGVAHRRCGKTVACINDMIRNAVISDKQMYRAAYIAPYLKQAKDVAWEYLKRYSQPIWAKPPNESELYVELIGGKRIKIYGADNPDSLRGGYLDDVTLDEYADMYPGIFGSIIRPMLADREGTATFIGTPKGRNAFFDLFERAKTDEDWFPFFLPASETGILPEAELTAAAREMTPEQYEQEFECSFEAAIIGAYYGKDVAEAERCGRITNVPHDPDLDVYTTWDLGIGDSTAIWFWQAHGPEIRVIDFYEANGESIEHYAKVLHSKPYRYEADWVPHDAKVRELGTGRTRIETMMALKLKPKLVPNHKVLDGINAGRVLFSRIWFDRDKCKAGLECLRQYRADYDEKARVFRDGPKHDWTSHCVTGDTEVLTRSGVCRIDAVPETGEVLTPCGWKPYRSPRITRKNAPLVQVTFSDGLTVRCTPDHMFMTAKGWRFAKDLTRRSLVLSCLTQSRSISAVASIANGQAIGISLAAARNFIATFGWALSALYRRDATSITGTGTQTTTGLKTWNALTPRNICLSHGARGGDAMAARTLFLTRPALALPTGIGQRLAACGIAAKPRRPKGGLSGNVSLSRAISVAWNLARSSARAVVASVSAPSNAKWLTIESAKPLPDREDVWCLTVPDGEWFALANGAVTHNSADAFRYLAMAYRDLKPDALVVPKPVPTLKDTTWNDIMRLQPSNTGYERA
jgi:hypothetical protein